MMPYAPEHHHPHRMNEHVLPKKFLSDDFVPRPNDVLVGRGRKCYEHIGNKRLRHIALSKLMEYSTSTSKHEKSKVLYYVAEQVERSGGLFIKEDLETGRWYQITDSMARDRISQVFRDALHEKYRSSSVFKSKKRKEIKSSPHSAGGCTNQSVPRLGNQALRYTPDIFPQYCNDVWHTLPQPSNMAFNYPPLQRKHSSAFCQSKPFYQICKEVRDDPFQPIPIAEAFSMEDSPLDLQSINKLLMIVENNEP